MIPFILAVDPDDDNDGILDEDDPDDDNDGIPDDEEVDDDGKSFLKRDTFEMLIAAACPKISYLRWWFCLDILSLDSASR